MARERILRELALLSEGGQVAELFEGRRSFVLYRDVPTAGAPRRLPGAVDVVVPVPGGYPAGTIDLAGLPVGSPLIPRVKGGSNPQGVVEVDGRKFQLASYHPHSNGGGPPWNPALHGFHTYLDQVLAWLHLLS